MQTEYEATFLNIDKDQIRAKLKSLGAEKKYSEYKQKRVVFHLPQKREGTWLRVRKEADGITMSLKYNGGTTISDQKETELHINDFELAVELLKSIGCEQKAYQENLRELWTLDEADITIDTWPFLEPFLEIEAKNESIIKQVAKKLNFDYSQAKFCSIDYLYRDKYNKSLDFINNQVDLITFETKNPFFSSP